MTRRFRTLLLASMASMAFATTVFAAAQDRYLGTWEIASSEPAPWPHKPGEEVPAEIRQLAGASVVIRTDRIDGPKQLACLHPHYALRQDGADMLFQGSLEEYGDKNTTPDKAATKLGFGKRPITTIETGCGNEIEFHAIDDDHLLFGLNNRVYRMERAGAASKSASSAKPGP